MISSYKCPLHFNSGCQSNGIAKGNGVLCFKTRGFRKNDCVNGINEMNRHRVYLFKNKAGFFLSQRSKETVMYLNQIDGIHIDNTLSCQSFIKQRSDFICSLLPFKQGNESASVENIRQLPSPDLEMNCRYWFSSSSLSRRRISRKPSTVTEESLQIAHIFSSTVSRLLTASFRGDQKSSKRAVAPAGICGGTSKYRRWSAGIVTVCSMVLANIVNISLSAYGKRKFQAVFNGG